jgi:serine protease Do
MSARTARILGFLLVFLPGLADAESASRSFSEVVKEARMSVVNLRSSAPLGDEGPMKGLGRALTDPEREAIGTGFLISPDGLIVTNDHVVSAVGGKGEILVYLLDRREAKARIVGRDPKTDIALLKVDIGRELPHISIGDSERLEVGEWVIAVGNPFGVEETVSVGIVSATGRSIGSGPYDNFIQTDAVIHPGNSGGPLLNLRGEAIGLVTALSPAGQGIGFAIPAGMVRKVSEQLRRTGRVIRAWLGVMIQEVTPDLAKAFGLSRVEGALVSDVMEESPAKTAGIQRGDIIVSFGGKKIDQMRKMPMMVAETEIGKEVVVVLIRNGVENRLKLRVAELPEESPPGSER